ncbi:MAG: HAD family hydrolase [Erysipelotrichales bacterium]|nr:HAD family hydrolase [Erysipelotrichales bacterium]
MNKVFFFDIDGTLYEPNVGVCESTKLAIKKLLAKGYVVAIASGRSYIGSKDIADELGVSYVVCDGGNSVYVNGEIVHQCTLDKDTCLSLITLAKEKDIPYILVDNEHYYGKKRSLAFEKVHPWIDYQGDKAFDDVHVMKLGFDVDKQQSDYLDKHSDVNMLLFKDVMCLVTDQNNKAEGIKECMKLLPESEIIVFGDSFNDIQMFEYADISVCMGQASKDVQKHANYVTDEISEDGIYKACVKYKWIEE